MEPEHVPLQLMVPPDTPQEFVLQALPYPGGFGGVVAEQLPLHPMVPELVWLQEFGVEVQELPYPGGSDGAEAEHEPLHRMTPTPA
ncbi:MAG: hypothetical protein Q8Q38_00420 [bacterium]|nr:hypothetical protein [bacterium]